MTEQRLVVPRTPEEIDDMLLDALIDCQKNGRYVRLDGVVLESARRLVERGHAQQDPGGDRVFIATPDGFRAKARLDEYTFHVPDDVQMALRLAHERGAGVAETLAALRSLAFVQAVLSGDVAEALNMKTHVALFSRPGMP
jgi:hypothetical protein